MKHTKKLLFLVGAFILAQLFFRVLVLRGKQTKARQLEKNLGMIQKRVDGKQGSLQGREELARQFEERQVRVKSIGEYLEDIETFKQLISKMPEVVGLEPGECIEEKSGYRKVRFRLTLKLKYIQLASFFKRMEARGIKLFVRSITLTKDNVMVANQARGQAYKKLLLVHTLVELLVGEDKEGTGGPDAETTEKSGVAAESADTGGAVTEGTVTEKEVARAVENYVDSFRARDIFWDWEWSPFVELEESMNDLKAQGWDTSGLESMLAEKKREFKATEDNGLVAKAGDVFISYKNNIESLEAMKRYWEETKGSIQSLSAVLKEQEFIFERITARDPGLEKLLKNPLRINEIKNRLMEIFDTFTWELSRLRGLWQEAGYTAHLFDRSVALDINRDDPDVTNAFEQMGQLAAAYRTAAENIGILREGETLHGKYKQTLKDMGFEDRIKTSVAEIERRFAFSESDFMNVDRAADLWRMVIEIKQLVPPVVAFRLSLKGIMHGMNDYVSLGYSSQAARLDGCQILGEGDHFRELVTVKEIGTDSAVLEHKGQTYTLMLRIADEIELMLPFKEGE